MHFIKNKWEGGFTRFQFAFFGLQKKRKRKKETLLLTTFVKSETNPSLDTSNSINWLTSFMITFLLRG